MRSASAESELVRVEQGIGHRKLAKAVATPPPHDTGKEVRGKISSGPISVALR